METLEIDGGGTSLHGVTTQDKAGASVPGRRFVITVGCLTFAYFALKVSWAADDAYITLRTVDNLIHGYGLRWNVIERVQVYTHPLWLFVLVPFKALFDSSLLALMVPGWITAISSVLLLLSRACTASGALTAFAALILSQSAVDFSTSGLENPLTHLLLVCLLSSLPSQGGGAFRAAGWCGLLLLNRLDLLPLVAPLVIKEVLSAKDPRYLWKSGLGLLPLGLWLAFSTVYYGSPFPNSYFAKIAMGVGRGEILLQGVKYFLDVALYEPLTLAVVISGIATGLAGRREDRAAAYLAGGMMLHLLYVFKVGGDFMNARFLTPGVVASAWIGMRAVDRAACGNVWPAWVHAQGAKLGAVVMAATLVVSDFHSFASRKAPAIRPSSITDERQFYFAATSFWLRCWEHLKNGEPFEAVHSWADLGRRLLAQQPPDQPFVHENMGFLGYYAGPSVHIVDGLGLTDAYVARLPIKEFWTAGHGKREVPDEYLESLTRRTNVVADPLLHQMFDDVAIATRSKGLFAAGRLGAIWRLNTGHYADVTTRPHEQAPGKVDGAERLVQQGI